MLGTLAVSGLCLNEQEMFPNVECLFHEREKELKRKMIAELPRRMSDRIALKAQREEQVGTCY